MYCCEEPSQVVYGSDTNVVAIVALIRAALQAAARSSAASTTQPVAGMSANGRTSLSVYFETFGEVNTEGSGFSAVSCRVPAERESARQHRFTMSIAPMAAVDHKLERY